MERVIVAFDATNFYLEQVSQSNYTSFNPMMHKVLGTDEYYVQNHRDKVKKYHADESPSTPYISRQTLAKENGCNMSVYAGLL